MLPTTIYAGQNGTRVQFSVPETLDEDPVSSRMVSVAVFSSTDSGEIQRLCRDLKQLNVIGPHNYLRLVAVGHLAISKIRWSVAKRAIA